MDQGRHPHHRLCRAGEEVVTPPEAERLAPRLANLRLRAKALAAIRSFFADHDYLEVETPQRVPSPGLELHLRAFPAGPGAWLNTSPEYQMKRLLAGGLERIYQLGHAFRDEERGAQHLPEFTMLEWYRAHASITDLMDETEALVRHVAAETRGTLTVTGIDGVDVDLAAPWERLTVAEAFERHASVETDGTETADELATRARTAGHRLPAEAMPWDEVFFRVFVDAVEPQLGRGRPTLLHRWPASQAALSRLDPQDPRWAQRFELYAGGLELANAFGELTDPAEQRRRLEHDQAERRARGLEVFPLDERFLAALTDGLPPVSGIALGVDRLVMLLCGARRIDDVVAFSPEDL